MKEKRKKYWKKQIKLQNQKEKWVLCKMILKKSSINLFNKWKN